MPWCRYPPLDRGDVRSKGSCTRVAREETWSGVRDVSISTILAARSVMTRSVSTPSCRAASSSRIPYTMPLLEKNHFLPDLGAIPAEVLKSAKLMFLNYPNNPTSAVATREFFAEAVAFASKRGILIAHDAAYSEMTYDGQKSPSILEIPGAKDVAIELFSLSKTYSMTGWRVGFAVGHPQAISLLAKVKSNLDSGIFQAIQIAGIAALKEGDKALERNLKIYQERRDLLISGLNKLGFNVSLPKAIFYCWIPVPPGYTSAELCLRFLEEMNIVVTPGNGFGPNGEGYFRISLTVAESRIMEALDRIKKSHKTK